MARKSRKKAAMQEEVIDVNAVVIPPHSRMTIQIMKEIVNLSDQEIYKALVEFKMDQSEAVDHLLRLLQEKSDVASSSTSGIDGPQNSDLTNVETKVEQEISDEGVSSSNVPSSSSDPPNVEAKLVPVSSGDPSSSEKQDDAPVKDDSSLHEKKADAPCSVSNSFTEPAKSIQLRESASLSSQDLPRGDDVSFFSRPTMFGSLRELLQESDSVYNQNLHKDVVAYNPLTSSRIEPLNTLCHRLMSALPSNQDNNNSKNNETYQVQSQNDPESSVVTSLQQLSIDQNDQSRTRLDYLANERMAYDIDITQWLNPPSATSVPSNQIQIHNFSNLIPKDPTVMHQQEYERNPNHLHSALTFNQSKPTIITNTTNESLLGYIPPISVTEAMRTGTVFEPRRNQQAMNQHYSAQPNIPPPSEHYGNMLPSSPFQQHGHQTLDVVARPPPYHMPQTATYLPPDMFPPSPSQQHGHGASYNINNNNNTYHQQNPLNVARPPPYYLPQTATYSPPNMLPPPFQQYGHGGSYNNTYHQQPLGYPMVPYMPRTATYLPPFQQYGHGGGHNNTYHQQPPFQHQVQSGNSNVWAMPGYNQNQQSPSLRHGQQQQEQRPYGASLGQQNNTSEEPFNQNQQWSWAKDHHNY